MTAQPDTTRPPAAVEDTDPRSWPAVWVLGLGTFLFVTTELLPVGLLPSIGAGVGVPVGIAGLVVSVYGGIAALTAAPLTSWVRRMDRRTLLVSLLGLLVLGNVISAVAPNYLVLMLGRVVIAFAHGVFWSTTPAVGTRLVEPRNAVRALSVVLGGISVASVVGVPLGTAIGQATNWRVAFLAAAGAGLLVLVAVLVLLPSMQARNSGGLAAIPQLLRNGPFLVAIAVAALTMIGHYLAYTYVTPYLEDVVGISPGMVSVLLLVFGAAGIAGNFLGGGAIAKGLRRALVSSVALLAASLLVISLTGGSSTIAAVVLLVTWGLSYAALPVCLQTWVLRSAPEATDAASSVYVAVFNASIALGALGGGIAVESAGVGSVTAVGAVLVAAALIVLLVSRKARHNEG
ncbi:MFS transporter [Actinokineospora cianjurensis]|uniref:Putative MFS family arabinose efflux permease n=1 Tax=Actinokineospora cianjurensis TaxID=585224 RepID=A0A421B2W1_9PSEU|nr:MFS transporter [Actinokineospora cianjurensis]RLK58719.1 putative MFS family arabinose efflux permease [Actinokineospora cianjurensis]